MKTLLSALILMISVGSFAQDCNEDPISSPEVKASHADAKTFFQDNLPAHYNETTFAHGVFTITVDCDGSVEDVMYQDGSMDEADMNHFIDKIKTMSWTAGKDGGETVKSNVGVSLKVNAGQASCAVH